jgi:signal transduction histidine kinase
MLREQEEKLYQEQLGFFTNIAYELQTPLTLISESVGKIPDTNRGQKPQKEKSGQFPSIVKHEDARLHYLVHELLEFRKAELGILKLLQSFLHLCPAPAHFKSVCCCG